MAVVFKESRKNDQVDSRSKASRLDLQRECPPMPPRLVVLRVNVVPWNENNVLRVVRLVF